VDVRVPGSLQPFVGRKAELDALAEAYAQASDGHARIVCVEGVAGIGKTALVRNFLAAASSPVVSASADEAEITLPWGVVSQLARGAPAGPSGQLRQLAELRPGADPLASGRLLLDVVGVLASQGPVALLVEDLHWIDHPSAQALRFALRRLNEEHVLALVTTRPEGAVQFDEGWRRLFDDRGQRLRLGGLQPAEVAQLVSALGGGTLSELAACRLWRHAGGNPLYTRCLVEELDPAVLAAASGPLPAPRSLATLLVARLAACAPATLDLVSAAAVLGERCSLALAALMADVPAPAGALGEAVAARLLDENHDDGVRQVQFPHPLVRAAIYADLSPARRAALHLSAARLTAGAAALSHRVAAAAGPDADLAVELAEAARASAAGGMHAAAAGHLISAADLSAEPALREDRLLAACTLWLRAGAVHEVSSRRALLEALVPSPRRDHLRGFLAHLEGRPDEARTALRAALDQLQATGGTDPLAAEAAARLAGLAVFDWDWQAALALVDSVPDTGALSLLIRCIALTMAGRTADARSRLDAARRCAEPGRGGVLERLARGFTAAWSDDLGGAKRDLEAIAGRPDGFGGSLRSAAHWLLADVYYRLGAFDDAAITAELARSLLQDTGRESSPEIAMAYAVAAYTASARGDWAGAQGSIAAADARAKPAASKFERACAAAARWSVAAALDDPPMMLQAARAFDAAADAPELSLFPFGPVLAEALWRNRRLEEAASKLAAYEAQARQLGRDSALVSACRIRGLLEADRHDTGAALQAFDEATPIAARLLQPLEAARFAAAHGLVLARLGKRKAAADRTAEARSVLQRIGAQPYLESVDRQLARIGGRGQRRSGTGELTASELAVAQLIASGLSNRQAAEQLTVSLKAIEFHLANIYAKLQVSSRSQLAARHDFRATLGPASARKS
jgi:ATP/maltotriose-dependent transcriptional regulator MalT